VATWGADAAAISPSGNCIQILRRIDSSTPAAGIGG